MEYGEGRTFDDMLVEDLEPTEEEQRAILGGVASQPLPEAEGGPRSGSALAPAPCGEGVEIASRIV